MNYDFTIDGMTFSFSRLNSFYDCAYGWKTQYIDEVRGENGFFGEFGSHAHDVLERFAKGELSIFELSTEYSTKYNRAILHKAPPNPYVNLNEKYYNLGKEYFDNFDGFPGYEIMAVEKKVKFKIDGHAMTGYIDLVVRNQEGKIEIIDHKSADMSPRTTRKKPTKSDQKLDDYLRQLYMYCIPIYEEFGEYPTHLNFNAFRVGCWIREPFVMEKLEETKKWVIDTIELIKQEVLWYPKNEQFWCDYVCSLRLICPEKTTREGWKNK